MYRLVCKHLGENEQTKNGTIGAQAADEWIDCWVGCANVLVQNNHKVEALAIDSLRILYCCQLGLGIIHEARPTVLGKDH